MGIEDLVAQLEALSPKMVAIEATTASKPPLKEIVAELTLKNRLLKKA